MSRIITIAAASILASLMFAADAFAHAHLLSTFPEQNSSINTSPEELDLNFSEALNLKFTGITLTGPENKSIPIGEPMLMDHDKMFMISLVGALAPGKYTVDWHAVSTDGHKTKGSYSFTIKP
jgi:hypothetical protein